MTPAPDNFMHETGSLTTKKLYENLHVYSFKTPTKKGTALFSTNHKKAGNNFNYIYHGFDDFFSAFVDKLSEFRS